MGAQAASTTGQGQLSPPKLHPNVPELGLPCKGNGVTSPQPCLHPDPTGTGAAREWIASLLRAVIGSSKFHRCARPLMASKEASNFNLSFLSPKSHFPS